MFITVIPFSSRSQLLLRESTREQVLPVPSPPKKKRCQKLPPAVVTQDQGIAKAKTSALQLSSSLFYYNFLLLPMHFQLIYLSHPHVASCLACGLWAFWEDFHYLPTQHLGETFKKHPRHECQAINTLDFLLGRLWLFIPRAYCFILGLERILIKKIGVWASKLTVVT